MDIWAPRDFASRRGRQVLPREVYSYHWNITDSDVYYLKAQLNMCVHTRNKL